MKILFSGGGTLGPVTPLFAIREMVLGEYPDTQFLWVGTETGPEKELIEKQGIPFLTISSGKLRRYFSFLNFVDLFRFVIGFFESLRLLYREKPDVCISAGGFVSVPLHYAAIFLGIPTWIHQQDIRVGLANKLMSFVSEVITVSVGGKIKNFSNKEVIHLGNPVRSALFTGNKERAKKLFGIETTLPVVFAVGGGTGSLAVNSLVLEALPQLEGVCEIIHVTGKERPQEGAQGAANHYENYHPYVFFQDEMKDAYALSDIVISRGGFGSLSELAALKKAAILIPKPGHQEENVQFLEKAHAVVMLDERTASGVVLANTIKELLADTKMSKAYAENLASLLPPAKKEDVIAIVKRFVK
jgi:UDP-N-acetylglucosamine--N-acetylmuramyl-(pentapeptide) pyrophosphoryl-undecaprenol N-acetylglucosamine transferase